MATQYYCSKCRGWFESRHCPKCDLGSHTPPFLIKVRNSGGYVMRSRGYKEGYSKDYLKDIPSETHA